MAQRQKALPSPRCYKPMPSVARGVQGEQDDYYNSVFSLPYVATVTTRVKASRFPCLRLTGWSSSDYYRMKVPAVFYFRIKDWYTPRPHTRRQRRPWCRAGHAVDADFPAQNSLIYRERSVWGSPKPPMRWKYL